MARALQRDQLRRRDLRRQRLGVDARAESGSGGSRIVDELSAAFTSPYLYSFLNALKFI
jgi:hypothetical protein